MRTPHKKIIQYKRREVIGVYIEVSKNEMDVNKGMECQRTNRTTGHEPVWVPDTPSLSVRCQIDRKLTERGRCLVRRE